MPVTSYDVGDRFVIRVLKSLQTNPDRKWANTYEFEALVAGSEDELLQCALAAVDFERRRSYTLVQFERVNISTWEEDSVPYDPAVFISSSLTSVGLNAPASDLQPLTTCLSVARVAASGRFGHIFYRGQLVEGDSTAPAGKAVLTDRPAHQTALLGALGDSGFDDFIGIAAAGGLRMVMINKAGTQTRPVVGLSVIGITQLPVDHTWFNRTSP